MSNRTYICTDCRTARRAPSAGWVPTAMRCRFCRGPLWELSQKWRIPKSTDLKAWEELRGIVARSKPYRERVLRCRGAHHLREIDRQVKHFSVRKPSKQRDDILRDLEKDRARVQRRYFGMGSGATA